MKIGGSAHDHELVALVEKKFEASPGRYPLGSSLGDWPIFMGCTQRSGTWVSRACPLRRGRTTGGRARHWRSKSEWNSKSIPCRTTVRSALRASGLPQGNRTAARADPAVWLSAEIGPTRAGKMLRLTEFRRKKAVGAPCSCQRTQSKGMPAREPISWVISTGELI